MTFGIIGCGRFGTLWANTLIEKGSVTVFDTKKIEATLDNRVVQGSLEDVCTQDIVFLLVPISSIKKVCADIKDYVAKESILVDCASVKVIPAQHIREILGDDQLYIPTHPLFGPDSVAASGLEGKKIVVCQNNVDKDRYVAFESLLTSLGLIILHTTEEDHDKQMAKSQALVHFIGRGLEDLNLLDQEIATPDYLSLLRMNSMVHNDTMQLFMDMQTYNPYANDIRQAFITKLQELEQKIDTE